ncbi:hypothetical protein [Lactiplantibacillus plantarum]|uniref:hypothetical protein n=1 Tax=Lactiplantibacillus plantarum TaxID=1590 RepID=UPI00082470DA|nr:hypothetical protein [Lactiplantibacillus plantarum]MZU59144.1 hypothetical protein [Lactiplantibacillus plantarum]MZU75896.1 hypothetical protein [Lactiplantibacillus plantarum]MZV43075.1 hypothetical protein [Lactiplantibacillus plantarum]PCE77660.1 hypothetical protein CJP39_16435 [Lactiplantibacillus plantarum]
MEKTLEKGIKITFKFSPIKKKVEKKRQYGEVSLNAIKDKLEAKGIPFEKYLAGYDFAKNWTEDQVIDEIDSKIKDEKPLVELDNEIVEKVNARKRDKKKTLYRLLELDDQEQGINLLTVSKYERECHITNDTAIQSYFNNIHSTIILNDNEKKFNKRETIISYLNDNYVWGIERSSHDVAREYLGDDLFNEWDGEAFDLGARNYVKSKDIWKGYRPYCKKRGFKPRQIATITEFNEYLNIHCPKLDGVGKDRKIVSSELVSDDDSIDMEKRVKVNTFIRRK